MTRSGQWIPPYMGYNPPITCYKAFLNDCKMVLPIADDKNAIAQRIERLERLDDFYSAKNGDNSKG